MSIYVCPECENYTYECSIPCPKCGHVFDNSKKIILKVKNNLNRTIYYDFSYGTGMYIPSNETEIIYLRANAFIKFYFSIFYNKENYTRYSSLFYAKAAKNQKYVDLELYMDDNKLHIYLDM